MFDVEFYPKTAVVGCGQVLAARDYTAGLSGSRVLVTIEYGQAPVVLELLPNGTLSGGGPVRLDGRLLQGMDVKDQPVFRSPSGTGSADPLEPGAPAN